MKCLFCAIAAKEIASEVIYEDEKNLAFLDIHPRSPGHIMVIPKKHAEDIMGLSKSDLAPLFLAVQKVTAKIKDRLKPDGFTIGINQGKASGQAVDHIHVHIIPRFSDDEGGSIHSVVDNPPKESIKEIARKITGDISSKL